MTGPASALDDGTNVKHHVEKLASDTMGGRLTGTEGERQAADYIASALEDLGAVPLPGQVSFHLPFEFTSGVKDVGSGIRIGREDRVELTSDGIRPLAFSRAGEVNGTVVFAGYGITVPESQDFGYDSYFGLDVQDKIVLVLRYFPEDASQEVKRALSRYSGLRYKAMNARERGAKGLLVVAGPRSPNAGELIGMSFDTATAGSGIVAASIDGVVAERLFESLPDQTLSDVQKSLNSGNPHVSGFEIPDVEISLRVALERELSTGHNVAGYFPASGESVEEDVVLVGAHYDHLGHGTQGNSLAKKSEAGKIHNGADDNASGVAAVLAVAGLVAEKERNRPVAFAFWSGEEMGLLGSAEFVKTDILPAGDIVAYVNFDMVGRMRDNRLVLQAVGSSSVWPSLIERTNVLIGFDVQLSEDPYLPTDAMSFNQAEIPTINFFTGAHEDYHRPSDDPDSLNYEDLERVAEFGALLTEKLANLEERPDFIKVARTTQEGGGRDSVRAYTGTIPDYATEVEGLLLGGVVAGGPAEEAGLEGGDVIVQIGDQKIANIYDYTFALDVVKLDEPIQVIFLRGDERKETTLTPRARK